MKTHLEMEEVFPDRVVKHTFTEWLNIGSNRKHHQFPMIVEKARHLCDEHQLSLCIEWGSSMSPMKVTMDTMLKSQTIPYIVQQTLQTYNIILNYVSQTRIQFTVLNHSKINPTTHHNNEY